MNSYTLQDHHAGLLKEVFSNTYAPLFEIDSEDGVLYAIVHYDLLKQELINIYGNHAGNIMYYSLYDECEVIEDVALQVYKDCEDQVA